ncbi:UDP-4-amino-4,6-dideoxy-N-acetyl-beta-L-altrosamine transaminase [Sphingomonas sp. LT1P40]|uniref:UDP-4-amino-4, 6-dideoxy-N-acetyl-beta-L-altrosamine transaminase n=1 Tax=Alteristakelama amylovorans TaxID=3096166 RepID=UPI002FC8FF67
MSFIPYSCQQIEDEDIAAVVAVLKSDFLTQGPAITAFEQEFAAKHDAAFGIAVCNATAALHIACLALDIGPGSLVWTSPNSFVASANCARYVGADVDFVDIDPVMRNMSLEALTVKLEAADAAGRLPNLLIPVDFAGLPCDMIEMRALADRYGFKIVEDASHAAGATYHGRPVGVHADICVFSFHAVKVVTTAEGGLLATNDPKIAERLELLRSHGVTRKPELLENPSEGGWYYEQVTLGYNYRMTDLQAALGSSQLSRIDAMQARRIAHADRYDELFADMPLKLPARANDRVSAWHLYAIELGDDAKVSRADVFAALRAAQIGANVHYIPIHRQPDYERLGFKRGDFPASEHYYDRAISLPLFPRMTSEQQERVVSVIRDALS